MQNAFLDLRELGTSDFPCITREKGNELAQAAAVCLESQGHESGTRLVVRGHFNGTYTLAWPPVSGQAQRTWNDPDETTEDGAVGIAVLLTLRETGWPVVLRSRKATGFDYWLGDREVSQVSAAERAATAALQSLLRDDSLIIRGRLEISGIRQGSDGAISRRVRDKLRQMEQSDPWRLPGFAIVVEFSRPLAEVSAQ